MKTMANISENLSTSDVIWWSQFSILWSPTCVWGGVDIRLSRRNLSPMSRHAGKDSRRATFSVHSSTFEPASGLGTHFALH